MAATRPIPEGMHTVTPNLVVRDAARAIDFYKQAFGAAELSRFMSPDGKSVWHAELRIGDSTVFLNDEMPGMGRPAPTADSPAPITMWLYVKDCDGAYEKALSAGARSTMEPADMFWGDRCSGVADPFGYQWSFATHQKDLTDEEMRRAGEAWAREAGMAQGGAGQGAASSSDFSSRPGV
ncbi:MAG: VOC family protein [Anaeromyxobacter sp.]